MNKRGRPTGSSPTAKKLINISLMPVFIAYVMQWYKPESHFNSETGKPNLSLVFEAFLDDVMNHLPAGPKVRHRDGLGRWTGKRTPPCVKPSRKALQSQIEALEKQIAMLKGEKENDTGRD